MYKVISRERNGVPILQLAGELTENAQTIELKQQLCHLSTNTQGPFVLDLSEVTAIDARTLGVFVVAQQVAQAHHSELRLLKPTLIVLQLLELIRLQYTFAIYNDEVAATLYQTSA